MLGVAAAVSVLAGALVVGDSVRGSLRDIALGRLGRTDQVLSSMGFFREGLSDDVKSAFGATDTAPLIVADAFVTLESSGRRASNVIVYGVDERFWKFQGLPPIDGVMVSPALAAEVGAKDGDVSSHASSEAVGNSDRVAVRTQGRRRTYCSTDARRSARARPARRVRAAAAAGRRARRLCAAQASPA